MAAAPSQGGGPTPWPTDCEYRPTVPDGTSKWAEVPIGANGALFEQGTVGWGSRDRHHRERFTRAPILPPEGDTRDEEKCTPEEEADGDDHLSRRARPDADAGEKAADRREREIATAKRSNPRRGR